MNNSAGILRVETHFSKNNVPPVGYVKNIFISVMRYICWNYIIYIYICLYICNYSVSQGKKISFADEHGDQLAHVSDIY